MKAAWQAQPERGSGALMEFIVWLSLSIGKPIGRLLLYPICAYFFTFSRAARAASQKYLSTIHGRPMPLREVYRHYHTFSRVLLDRPFFLKGRLDEFDIAIKGAEIFDAQRAKNRGCLLLGAHLGSFEVLRALGMFERQLPIKILMYPDNSRRISRVFNRLNPDMARTVIPLGRPDTMLLAKQHLDGGGIVGLLGDRITRGDKLVSTRFLGRPASLPAGPMLLAGLLKVPVVFFCGLYKGGSRYEVHFELFAEQVTIDPKNRERDLQIWIDRYAERLDHYCRLAPYNWFNFYEFWEPVDSVA
jgi:predicted LPLAT superfamily acyltransferase